MSIIEELEIIRNEHDGILRPKDVVSFARNPKTKLHKQFEWDNTKAARQYRIEQAKKIIRVTVTMLPYHNDPVRAYVSLSTKRGSNNGSYYFVADVIKNKKLRKVMLSDALAEFESFRKKYSSLKLLGPLFDEFDRIKKKGRRKRKDE